MQEGLRILTQIFWKCKTTVSYRPNMIASEMYKKLKISRNKTYEAFQELVEHGHCIRIRTMNGNLRAEVDYVFFDEVSSCEKFIKDNHNELESKDLQVEHKWNLKKCFRHSNIEETEGRKPAGREVLKKIAMKEDLKKKDKKEELSVVVAGAPPLDASHKEPSTEEKEEPKAEPPLAIVESSEPVDESSLPAEVDLLQNDGKRLKVTQSDIWAYCVRDNLDLSADAIRYAWKTLCEYPNIVHNWRSFIEGTAKNYEKKKKSNKIIKGNQCNQKMPQKMSKKTPSPESSKDYKKVSLETDSSEQPCQELVSLKSLLPKSPNSLWNLKSS
jgi:hypothetical protein